jgi:hypothetical protein
MATLQTLTKTLTTATKLTTNIAVAEDKLNPSKTTPIMNHKVKSILMCGNPNKIINKTTIKMRKKTKASAGSVKLKITTTREPYRNNKMNRKKKTTKSVGCPSKITKIKKKMTVLKV